MASNTEMNDKDIEIIMNQTDYTKERATEMLIKYNYNKEEVILAYIKGSYHTPVNTYKKSYNTNQNIYKTIGDFLK